MFAGGAVGRMAIFALNIMPYISASIIMQLMSVVVPTLEQIKKEGESGRRKITQYTRYGTVVLATFQAIGVSIALQSQTAGGLSVVINPGAHFVMITTVTLVCGTIFLKKNPNLGRLWEKPVGAAIKVKNPVPEASTKLGLKVDRCHFSEDCPSSGFFPEKRSLQLRFV